MTVDELIKAGLPVDHSPDQDYDSQILRIGQPDPSHNHEIPDTDVTLRRSVSLAARESNPEGWKVADIEILNHGAWMGLNGLTAKDLDRLGKFLTDYAERIRSW